MSQFTEALVRIVRAEIGVHEDGESNTGARVNEYKSTTRLPAYENWPWCAAFVDWGVYRALLASDIPQTATFRRPTTAGAWDLIRWSLAQDGTTKTMRRPGRDIQPGDIVVYEFSHCGIAVSTCDDTGHFLAVEGNTSAGVDGSQRNGGGVHQRTRRSNQVKARIRFTV
jgi:hypothetical protein